jgi:hypothetical protein
MTSEPHQIVPDPIRIFLAIFSLLNSQKSATGLYSKQYISVLHIHTLVFETELILSCYECLGFRSDRFCPGSWTEIFVSIFHFSRLCQMSHLYLPFIDMIVLLHGGEKNRFVFLMKLSPLFLNIRPLQSQYSPWNHISNALDFSCSTIAFTIIGKWQGNKSPDIISAKYCCKRMGIIIPCYKQCQTIHIT